MRILLISHSTLSKAMLETAEMIMGKTEEVAALGLFPGDSSDDFEDSLRELVESKDSEEECLILCDIISGTPFNVASKISYQDEKIKVIYGMNLAIVIEALSHKRKSLNDLSQRILEIAPKSYGVGKY